MQQKFWIRIFKNAFPGIFNFTVGILSLSVPVKAADQHKYKAQFSMIHQNNEQQLDSRLQQNSLESFVLLLRDVEIDKTEYHREAPFQTTWSIGFV